MLKIEVIERANENPTLRIEGRVIGPWVGELRRMCEPLLATGARLTIDLSDVSFVDRDGIELFRSLRKHRVALANCSPFVAEQLKAWERP
jgi:anti-anti-sigma regulatory factor